VLLIQPDHIGDVLLATPAIANLRALLPQAELTALVGPWGAPALANNPHLDAVATCAFPGFARHEASPCPHPYALLWQTARHLSHQRYDAAVVLRPDFWWGAALTALARIPTRIGFDLAPGAMAYSHHAPVFPRSEHAARRSVRLAQLAGHVFGASAVRNEEIEPASHPLVFTLAPTDREWATAWLAGQGLDPALCPVVVHPGSGAAVKWWPARHWAAVITVLAQATGAPVVIGGTPDEAPAVARLRDLAGTTVQTLACTQHMTLGHYAALLERARLVLGVDSGPLHLATAVSTPTVRLYGPTDPAVFGPWGPPEWHKVVTSGLPCAPCGRLDYLPSELPAHPCLRLIMPEMVVQAAQEVLQRSESRLKT
jgi:ADP-heptose:LPS heptosyltransferase